MGLNPKRYTLNANNGFTLIEIVLSLALVAALAALSAPFLQSFQVKSDVGLAADAVAQNLRRAQTNAQSVDGDISWGVKIQAGSVVIFKGASYAGRDASFDEIFNLSSAISPSGLSEIVFAKFSGLPQATGTITLASSTGETKNIVVNAKGMVEY